jgi:hypothetical protein
MRSAGPTILGIPAVLLRSFGQHFHDISNALPDVPALLGVFLTLRNDACPSTLDG